MKIPQIAHRYAKALYELAVDTRTQDKVMSDLRSLDAILGQDQEIQTFLTHPMIKPEQRAEALQKALADKGLSKDTVELIMLLVRNERMHLFSQIVAAYEAEADAANKVARGSVRSAAALAPEERKRIEETVEKVLKKKVILTYKVDPSVIGGLIAEVGSYTFDDTIASHLRRMNEEIKRRTV